MWELKQEVMFSYGGITESHYVRSNSSFPNSHLYIHSGLYVYYIGENIPPVRLSTPVRLFRNGQILHPSMEISNQGTVKLIYLDLFDPLYSESYPFVQVL